MQADIHKRNSGEIFLLLSKTIKKAVCQIESDFPSVALLVVLSEVRVSASPMLVVFTHWKQRR